MRNKSVFIFSGYIPNLSALAIKIVSVRPSNTAKGRPTIPGKIVVLDEVTGYAICSMQVRVVDDEGYSCSY